MAEEKTTSKTPPLKTDVQHNAPKALRPAENSRPTREAHALDGPGAIGSPEGKKLVVGREIELSGNISACDRLIVEGRVEAKLRDCRKIEVASSGFFKGNAEIDTADSPRNPNSAVDGKSNRNYPVW